MGTRLTSEERSRIHWCQLYFALPREGVARRFPTAESAEAQVCRVRWPSGIRCPRCEAMDILHFEARKRYQCRKCRHQFSAKTGTIFHGSNITIRKWLLAAEYIIASYARDRATYVLTSHQLKDRIGLSYKVAHARRKDLMNDLTNTTPGLIARSICTDPIQLPPDLVPYSSEHLMWCRDRLASKPA
ncbi:transposase [Yoonia sp. 2307UL14-13]|uniref:transposase n=1 Tax=Yoonia sp. 2307UL14-13 TaxID=3126506 RepID=UPI0030AFFB2D